MTKSYMCVCVCVLMCMCALTNTNTQTHVHRHTHIHRHTRTHKVTKTHMHSFTHTLGNWGNNNNTRSMQSSNIIKSSQTQTHTQTHTQTCLLRSGNNYNIDFICRANLWSSNFSQSANNIALSPFSEALPITCIRIFACTNTFSVFVYVHIGKIFSRPHLNVYFSLSMISGAM